MFTFKLYLSWEKTVLRNIKAPLKGCFSVAERTGDSPDRGNVRKDKRVAPC